ncbi:MAG TPA: hypothetical protein VM686_29770 [Polyangiaceae bacterium]|nr:hypothetical protein [Polyangiaceae bacterium]
MQWLPGKRQAWLRLRRRGEITSDGVADGMVKIIEGATRSYDRGHLNGTSKQLQALSTEAGAQEGTHITARAERIVQDDIAYVLAHL